MIGMLGGALRKGGEGTHRKYQEFMNRRNICIPNSLFGRETPLRPGYEILGHTKTPECETGVKARVARGQKTFFRAE